MVKEIQELTHARLEPAIAGFPGLFTARQAERASGGKTDVKYQLGDVELVCRAADRLLPSDLLTLAALVALAGPGRQEPAERDKALVCDLAIEPPAAAGGTLVVETHAGRLLSECGRRDGGEQRARLRDGLRRLAGLVVFVKRGAQEVSMHLLSYTADMKTGVLRVALSPRLSAAILGGRHVRIDMRELRELGEHALIIYVRLCTWIDPGRTRRVGINALDEYLWPESAKTAAGGRKRRQRLRRAMAELCALPGWRVETDARGRQYTVNRPGAAPAVVPVTRTVVSVTRPVVPVTPKSTISL